MYLNLTGTASEDSGNNYPQDRIQEIAAMTGWLLPFCQVNTRSQL
jgi:hypothetical protein